MRPIRRSALLSVAALALVAGLLAACGGGEVDDLPDAAPRDVAPHTDAAVPDWVRSVYPSPDAETAIERAVEVEVETLQEGQEIRLLINNIDVTSQALIQPAPSDTEREAPTPGEAQPTAMNRLRYDPRDRTEQDEAPFVTLVPGEHSATVQLMERPAFGAPARELESFTWNFRIQ